MTELGGAQVPPRSPSQLPMSDIRDRLNEFVRDHADFTMAVLALTVLALCAVVWLWGRQTRQLRLLLAQERNANRAVLPAPSEAVMAVVASGAAGRDLDDAPQPGNREVERSGRAMYSVAHRPEQPVEPTEPLVRDSLGWTVPPAAVDGGSVGSAGSNGSARSTDPGGSGDSGGSTAAPGWKERAATSAHLAPPTPTTLRETGSESPTGVTAAAAEAAERSVPEALVATPTPPSTPVSEPHSAPAAEPHNVYSAWDTVTTPVPEGAGGLTSGDGGEGAYVAWNRSIAEGDTVHVEDPQPSLQVGAPFLELAASVASSRDGANGASPTASELDGRGPDAQPTAFAPWSVPGEPTTSPPPFSPGPAPRSWAPPPAAGPASSMGAWTPPTQAPAPSPPQDVTGTDPAINVLLVEDDENVSKVYRLLLESKGYCVRIASDGTVGLDEGRRQRPDLVLLDVMMPRMNGILFLQELRAEPGLESVPVVILSNFKEPRLVERALALGALEYMVKAQTRPEALLSAIPRWVRNQRAFAG